MKVLIREVSLYFGSSGHPSGRRVASKEMEDTR